MADDPNDAKRRDLELILFSRLESIADDQRQFILAAMGEPPDVRRVPAKIWRQLEREWSDALFWALYKAHLDSGLHVWQEIGRPDLDDRRKPLPDNQRPGRRGLELPAASRAQDQAARNWAGNAAKRLSRGLVKTTQKRLEATRAAAKGAGAPDYAPELTDLFGKQRFELIAATEITAALSAGAVDLGKILALRRGFVVEIFWITEADENVCPICRPLHEQPEWRFFAWVKGYPPAHPRCRCGLRIEVLTAAGRLVAMTFVRPLASTRSAA